MNKLIDYVRMTYYYRKHHERFVHHVESLQHKLICQDCGGSGGYVEPILEDGSGPFYECGWCEGTGYVTPYLRGLWLKFKREEKLERRVENP